MDQDTQKKISEKWSKHVTNEKNKKLKLRWWESQFIIRNINRTVCGESLDERSQGLIALLKQKHPNLLPFKKGLSIGCGNGKKEMNLINQNIVDSFDLYELSDEMIAKGKQLAAEFGLSEKINFIKDDAFSVINEHEQYDIVHWGDALHHMFNVDSAVSFSKKVLIKGGLFLMDDFVGATRFQWSEKSLAIASSVRKAFTKTKYLTNPYAPQRELPTQLLRPNEQKVKEEDPSEAADSENIIKAVKKYFPNAEIKITGGVIYHLALSDMLNNFDESKEKDQLLLNLLMIIDNLCVDLGETHYATALAIKD